MRGKKVIVVGATSGIGFEVACRLLDDGWTVGVAGRRKDLLEKLCQKDTNRVQMEVLDVTQSDAAEHLETLIQKLGGMDLFFLSSGVGFQNPSLTSEIEVGTMMTNGVGFTRMVTAAFAYFKRERRAGHIAVISSVAGTKGIGVAPAYSASKRFQNTYIDALAQLVRMQHLPISFTDIRPGFVATDLLKDRNYPMLMKPDRVAEKIVAALKKKRRVVVIDNRYRVLVFFWRLIPRWLWERIVVG